MKRKTGVKRIENWAHLGKADFHIHSNFSDGKPSPAEILEYVENETDLNVIAITDHDTIDGALEARELIKTKKYHFDLIIGEEITSKSGHILGLFLEEKIEPELSVQETLKRIHQQGGIAVPSHPFMHTRFKDEKLAIMDGIGANELIRNRTQIDAIEIVNATPTLSDENLAASILNKTVLLRGETGGSDAHIIQAIGRGYTVFEGKSANDLKKALENHQTRAIYGKWTLMALLQYLYFYIPVGLRLFWHTTVHYWDKRNGKL